MGNYSVKYNCESQLMVLYYHVNEQNVVKVYEATCYVRTLAYLLDCMSKDHYVDMVYGDAKLLYRKIHLSKLQNSDDIYQYQNVIFLFEHRNTFDVFIKEYYVIREILENIQQKYPYVCYVSYEKLTPYFNVNRTNKIVIVSSMIDASISGLRYRIKVFVNDVDKFKKVLRDTYLLRYDETLWDEVVVPIHNQEDFEDIVCIDFSYKELKEFVDELIPTLANLNNLYKENEQSLISKITKSFINDLM